MLYKLALTGPTQASKIAASGIELETVAELLIPWQPSTWPSAPSDSQEFAMVLKRVFEVAILMEIKNVIDDAHARTGSLDHRGYVVAIALFCALDAISSYGYGAKNGAQVPGFIDAHFPAEYKPFANEILKLFRHASVHSWHFFKVGIHAGDEGISQNGDVISFGLLNFFNALVMATENFLEKLSRDEELQIKARGRYESLRKTAVKAQASIARKN
jgi:hypothetical protein